MAISLRALGAAGVLLVLSACATTPPPAVSVTPTVESPAPTASASPEPSVTESPTGSMAPTGSATTSATTTSTTSATPSPTATDDGLVLRPKGLGGMNFGRAEGDVTALLTAKAGQPDDSYSGKVCELDSDTPYGRQLAYGGAAFLFQSKAKGNANSKRTFTSWVLNLGQPLPSALRVADGFPVDASFSKLKSAFPKGKLSKIALGESAVYVFRTPAGIWYRGDDSKTPTDMGSGPMGTCE